MATRVPPTRKPKGALLSFRSTSPTKGERKSKRQPKTGPRLSQGPPPPADRVPHSANDHEPTAAQAAKFVKFLNAGVPPRDALALVRTDIADGDIDAMLRVWGSSTALAHATALANGGAWEDLDNDTRLRIARDKTLAEYAYFLYTHRFDAQTDPSTARRIEEAMAAITAAQKSSGVGDPDTPWQRFVSEQIEKGEGGEDGPPTLTELPLATST